MSRLQDNADCIVLEEHPVAARGNMVSDETIFCAVPKAQKDCPFPLRHIVSADPESEQTIALLTNHFEVAAGTIGAICKDLWQMELLFKALKQNLRVNTLVGTTENALRIQNWTALMAILLITFMRFKAASARPLSNRTALLRWNLFTYRN